MSKKYKLKPGRHQFAPRSPAIHTNDNFSDEEAEWYLERYPHIASLFEAVPHSKSGITVPEVAIEIKSPGEESAQSQTIGGPERSDLMNAAEKQ